MKLSKYICAALAITSLTACSLDEEYKSQLAQDAVYTTASGYDGLINACYENLYYLYGKEDGIAMMENCSDLWMSSGGGWAECVNNNGWTTEVGPNKVVWKALYAIVAYCNTAIYYQDKCTEYSDSIIKSKVAEAYFMRAFAYWHIVEQWGGVTLTTTSMAEAGAREFAYRNTEEEIYDQIISDLNFAYRYLPVTQGEERGRATKYAAAAMLCKAWIQRTRLERDKAENPDGKTKWVSQITADAATPVKYTTVQCADSAYKYAKIVINESPYKLYESDATSSGSTKEWSGDNNKNNQEFIFLEAIDHIGGYNPEGWNRGRTRQYYMTNMSAAGEFGVSGTGIRYGRSNTNRVRPTLYLLVDCFDPRPSYADAHSIVYDGISTSSKNLQRKDDWTPDTRFDDSFYYKYFIASSSFTVPYSTMKAYLKDTVSQFNYNNVYKNPAYTSRYTITGNVATGEQLKASYPGLNYYADATTSVTKEVFELEDKAGALGMYTPNFPVDRTWASKKKYLVAGTPSLDGDQTNDTIAYMRETGATGVSSYYRGMWPSLKKLSPLKYCNSNQQSLNDFPIIRLTDIYLLGAEATILSGHNQVQGLEWLNAVRKHAALSTNAKMMEVGSEAMNIDFLAKERARELCGENLRWYDLKRMGLLTSEYLNGTRKNIAGNAYQTKWYVRPIPQELLNQIANPDEYGTNGY